MSFVGNDELAGASWTISSKDGTLLKAAGFCFRASDSTRTEVMAIWSVLQELDASKLSNFLLT